MSITVNGQSVVPPGFRFHPTEEELLSYYLRKKVACEKIDLDVIRDVDLNKLEPWDIQEKCRIGSTPQNDWYFFSHKDKKYPTGTRTNRATAAGFWKATGRDKIIHTSCKRIGMRKTLVFYKGRAPRGQKSDWIMHEYRLDDHFDSNSLAIVSNSILTEEAFNQEDGWVICRVFKKKNLHKAVDNPNSSSSVTTDAKNTHLLLHSSGDGALDQILQYMGRSCKLETEFSSNSMNINKLLLINERFMKLPALQSPTIPSVRSTDEFSYGSDGIHAEVNINQTCNADTGISDWAALDKLIASQLNGQFDDSTFLLCQSNRLAYNSQDDVVGNNGGSSSGDGDLWSLASSGSEHITRASHPSM